MTVREAMDIINGALDSLSEFYDNDVDSIFFKEIDAAKAAIEKFVQKEENKLENCYAHCPECGEQLLYDDFIQDTEYCEDVVLFEAEGHCPHCQSTYTWKETFALDSIEFDND